MKGEKELRREIKGTRPKEEKEMLNAEIKGADSVEGRYEIHEGKM